MLEVLTPETPDALLSLMQAFAADAHPAKIDLAVGVYRDEEGNTPVPAAVRAAELRVLESQRSKVYLGGGGNLLFAHGIEQLVLGPHSSGDSARTTTLQCVGGCGALRLAADLIQRCRPSNPVAVSAPTWPNHQYLMSSAGLRVCFYPYYYDAATATLRLGEILEFLEALPAGSVVLLQASCHNPTGVDPTSAQWREILEVLGRGALIPLFDLAYQGLGLSLPQDVAAIRHAASMLPEMFIAVSCSKTFGLYRERVGALICSCETAATAALAASQMRLLARRSYTMPPDHGAAVAACVLADSSLYSEWLAELSSMRNRVVSIRHALADALARRARDTRFEYIRLQTGLFSLLQLSDEAVAWLRSERHVYLAPGGRINVAGLRMDQVDSLADSISGAVVQGCR